NSDSAFVQQANSQLKNDQTMTKAKSMEFQLTLYPSPSLPRRFPCGILTSSKFKTQVLLALIPSFFSFFAMENPGVSFSTMNAVMPLYPFDGSKVAKTM